jgi:hypothetical protein
VKSAYSKSNSNPTTYSELVIVLGIGSRVASQGVDELLFSEWALGKLHKTTTKCPQSRTLQHQQTTVSHAQKQRKTHIAKTKQTPQ